jgi:hypothetical protein
MKSTCNLFACLLAGIILLIYCSSKAETPSKPSAPVDDWKGTNFNTAFDASVATGEPFGISIHEKLTPSGHACSEQLNAGNYRQDILHSFESNVHYDNCAFDSAFEYIQSLIRQCDTHFRDAPQSWHDSSTVPKPVLDGMLVLGQILHAIQDFYAHSNYVELVQQISPVPKEEQDIPIAIVWTEKGQREVQNYIKAGLVSGRVWWTLPHHCEQSAPTHAELAKDSEKSSAGAALSVWERAVGSKKQNNFNVAYNMAHRGTRKFLQWSGGRWPQIEKYCGRRLKYIITGDKRQANLPDKNP